MTAIAGYINLDGRAAEQRVSGRLASSIAMYGPDDQRTMHCGNAGFVRALLRVTPEDSFDRQPLRDSETGVVVLFDGRIDNRRDLWDSMGGGVSRKPLQTMPDGEIVLHAYLKFGESVFGRLRGDFTVAIWLAKEKRLILVRDPMGLRPLYWFHSSRLFAFCTMPKGLFALDSIERRLCSERLTAHLSLMPEDGESSFFEGVSRVRPGWLIDFHNGEIKQKQYHRFKLSVGLRRSDPAQYVEEFRHLLDQAVSRRLRSRGGISAHLSAGLDSGTVTSVAASLLARQGKGLTAYTAVPTSRAEGKSSSRYILDESERAEKLARKFRNIEHKRLSVAGRSIFSGMEADIERLDRPPMNPCNMMWINAINEDARKHGSYAVLCGFNGNMTISRSGSALLPLLLVSGRWFRWFEEARALCSNYESLSLMSLLKSSTAPVVPNWLYKRIFRRTRLYEDPGKFSAISPALRKSKGWIKRFKSSSFGREYQPSLNERASIVSHFQGHDLGDYFAAANCYGIEMRDPTADLDLVSFLLSIPEDQFLRNGEYRWLLRSAMSALLPPEYFDRQQVAIQSSDWLFHLRNDLALLQEHESTFESNDRVSSLIDTEGLNRLSADIAEADAGVGLGESRYRYKYLRGLATGSFIKRQEPDNK